MTEQHPAEHQPREEQFLDPVAQALEAIKKAGGKPATGKNADLPRMARKNGWNRGRRGTLAVAVDAPGELLDNLVDNLCRYDDARRGGDVRVRVCADAVHVCMWLLAWHR